MVPKKLSYISPVVNFVMVKEVVDEGQKGTKELQIEKRPKNKVRTKQKREHKWGTVKKRCRKLYTFLSTLNFLQCFCTWYCKECTYYIPKKQLDEKLIPRRRQLKNEAIMKIKCTCEIKGIGMKKV